MDRIYEINNVETIKETDEIIPFMRTTNIDTAIEKANECLKKG